MIRDGGLYWANPAARTLLPFMGADSHWPRDITLSPCLRQPTWLMHKHEVGMGVMRRRALLSLGGLWFAGGTIPLVWYG